MFSFVRQQVHRVTGGVPIDEIRDLSAAVALQEEINVGWQYYNTIVEAEKEKEAATFMAVGSESEDEAGEDDPVPMLEDEFFCMEDLPKNFQNRQNYPNYALIAMDGGVAPRLAARMLTGAFVDIGLVTKQDKCLVVDRSKMQRQTKKVQDLLLSLNGEEVRAHLDCLMFDSAVKKCQILKTVNGKPVTCMGKRDLYALVDGNGKYFSHLNQLY